MSTSQHAAAEVGPVVTGAGLATALGALLDGTWSALLAGQSISSHASVPSLPTAGRFNALTQRVADAALHDAQLFGGPGDDAALILGTSKGPVADWLDSSGQAGGGAGLGLSAPAVHLARRLKIGGPCVTLSAACSSGLHALIHAALLIRSGRVRRALVVAVESSIHPLFMGSFSRLGILAGPGEACRPFDQRRTGFLMSEAAAAVVLEADQGQEGQTRIEHFAFGADATHLTGSDPQARALSRLMRQVIGGRPVDLVHAHGTGTLANDELELATIETNLVASPERPSLYSHKGALGHSLGAAGLVSIVLNRQCHRLGIVPPNVTTTSPMATTQCVLEQTQRKRHIRRSLAIAAGFGGALAVVSLVNH